MRVRRVPQARNRAGHVAPAPSVCRVSGGEKNATTIMQMALGGAAYVVLDEETRSPARIDCIKIVEEGVKSICA